MSNVFRMSATGLAVLAIAALLNPSASAQQRRGGGRGMFEISRVQLATLDQVQTELKLSDEQKAHAQAVNEKWRGQLQELFQGGGGFQASRERMPALVAENTAALVEKLDDAQKKRLTELYVQVNGLNSLADGDVAKAIGLSEDQQKQIEEARSTNRQEMMDAFQDFQQMSDDERTAAREKLQKAGEERLTAVLTDAQKEAFAALKGTEMELDLSSLQFGGRGGGGGQGRRGGGGAGGGGDRPARPQ